MPVKLLRLRQVFYLSGTILLFVASRPLSAATFANTYVCRPVNANTSIESAVRLFDASSESQKSFMVNGRELGRVRISHGVFGVEAVGSVTNIADATMDYKLVVPQVALNRRLDPSQVSGMVIRSLVGTMTPPGYVHEGPIQYLEFDRVACDASLTD
jgi:hypothetical protein